MSFNILSFLIKLLIPDIQIGEKKNKKQPLRPITKRSKISIEELDWGEGRDPITGKCRYIID